MRLHRAAKKYAVSVVIFASIVVRMLLPIHVYAQVVGATLTGTVTDPSGAVVSQAEVSIENTSTAIATLFMTNAEGIYAAPNLPAGNYQVTVSAKGFKTEVSKGVNLTVGAQQVLNISLQVGAAAQRVEIEVTDMEAAVELASSSVDGVVSAATIVELPLNGRDWTTLAALQPGVSKVLTQQPNVGNSLGGRGYGQEFAISGTRPQLNNYRIDGISVVDYAGGSPGSTLGVALGVDAIAEFSVVTSNASAEYGRSSGGVINAITRSGTNTIHGSAFWFLRDEGLDARNYFDSETIPPFHRNQFGGSVGGPIKKDTTFFFVNYEGFRQNLGTTFINLVPSQDARKGILHNSDGTTTTVTVDPLVAPFLPLYPLPNAGLIGTGDTGLFDIATNAAQSEDYLTTRIDRKFSSKDSISATFFRDRASNTSPDNLDTQIVDSPTTGYMVAVEESHLFSPTLMNSVRGGFHRVTAFPEQSVQAINPLAKDLSLSSFPGRYAPSISVPGLANYDGGLGALSSQAFYWNSIQAYDDAFLTKGKHLIKFGFAFERMQLNNRIFPDNGNFNFGSLQGFLTNQPSSFNGAPPNNVSGHGDRQTLFGGYLQDDWHARHNLTLNLGLRYEMVTVPTEVENKISNMVTFTSPAPKLGSPYFNNPTLRNVEPRVGLVWDPFGKGKTAVRAAFGIFDVLPLIYEFSGAIGTSAPFTEKVAAAGTPGSFPTGIVDTIFGSGPPSPTSLRYGSIQVNPPRNYLMLWNLNIQHELTPNTTFMFGYVGNHGVHMLNRADDVNMVLPQATPQGLLWPFPAGSGTILNPAIGDIRGEYWTGTALYDALELQLTKRMSHGFHVQGSYTWGKNIDTGSASVIGDPFTNSITSPLWFCSACRRGLSDFNIGQTLVVNYVWDLPTPGNWGAVASHLLGGWELAGIITAETGVPFTPLIGGDPLGENSTDPFAYPSRVAGPGCSSAVNPGNTNNYVKLSCFSVPMATPTIAALCTPFSAVPGSCANLFGNAGRNSVVGPGLATWDFSLVKNTNINERLKLQFRAELFNILNKPNFGTPVDNSTFFDSGGNPVGGAGLLDTTSTTSRQVQLGLKLVF